ncbi:MAG: M23 family metallopeptidase [Polymorphobacter sp.]|uniref:M23 family metallopeptidase n=1 Tax=Polymorphobacter sp. TaxID=1909290 RepID=UPI003A881738
MARWREAAAGLALGTELSTDLGSGIGGRSWWLGLMACVALCGTAITLALDVPLLPAAGRAPLSEEARENLRGQFLAPLAMGARSGVQTRPDPARVVPLSEIPERPRIELTARIIGGRSLGTTLQRSGVSANDIARATALLKPEVNLRSLKAGTEIELVLGRRASRAEPRPLERLALRSAFDMRLAVERTGDELTLRKIPIKVDSTPVRVNGLVGRSLLRSLQDAGIPGRQAREYMNVMGYVVDMQRGVGAKDRFDIIVARDKAETGEERYGGVLYGALDRLGKDRIEVARFGPGGEFYRDNGESARKGLMRTPVNGARMTSRFGMRFHPLLNYSRMHQGVDFGARHGAPIYAAASGTVEYAAPHGGHGNYVRLRHNSTLKTAYAHMSRFAVRRGQSVKQGDVIGYVGSTGVSTGPHLHYEVWLRGKAVNPMTLKFTGGSQLSGADMSQFKTELDRLRATAMTGVSTPASERPGRRPA